MHGNAPSPLDRVQAEGATLHNQVCTESVAFTMCNADGTQSHRTLRNVPKNVYHSTAPRVIRHGHYSAPCITSFVNTTPSIPPAISDRTQIVNSARFRVSHSHTALQHTWYCFFSSIQIATSLPQGYNTQYSDESTTEDIFTVDFQSLVNMFRCFIINSMYKENFCPAF